MSKGKKDLSFDLDAAVTRKPPVALVKKVAEDIERLLVDVSPAMQKQIKERALASDTTVKEYVLKIIYKHMNEVSRPAEPYPSMRGQRRLILEVPAAEAVTLRRKAQRFSTFKEFVLRCLEAEGIAIG
ncbi:MAG TPA: hypothetical protein PK156_33090 [Polyangium sp.]|nr:hypothetical protein [Polyangium sp.]